MTIDHPDPMATDAPLPAVLTVSQLHDGMQAAFTTAGLEEVWVGGIVTGLRRGPRFCSWELVEYGDEAAEVRAVLSVGTFPRQLAEIDAVLQTVGLELTDGLEVSLRGRLDSNPGFGRLRLLAQRVDPRASIGAAVLAGTEWWPSWRPQASWRPNSSWHHLSSPAALGWSGPR